MSKIKSVYIPQVNWRERFEEVNGSYYDYVAEFGVTIYKNDWSIVSNIIEKFIKNDWELISCKDERLVLLLKDKHLIRIFIYEKF